MDDSLRSRIANTERKLTSFLSARDAEIRAKEDYHRQIRDRNEALERELETYRDRLAKAESEKNELAKLMETLLDTIDRSAGRPADAAEPTGSRAAEPGLGGATGESDDANESAAASENEKGDAALEIPEPDREPPSLRELRVALDRASSDLDEIDPLFRPKERRQA